MKYYKWLFLTNTQILLDNDRFGRLGNIEIWLESYYQKLRIKQIRRGYII